MFHLVLGVIAVRLALGDATEEGGAFATLVGAPFGRALVWTLAAALLVYGGFRLARGARPDPDDPRTMPAWARQVVDAARGGFHVALAGLAGVTAWRGGGSASGRGATAALLGHPAGRALAVAVGAGVCIGALALARQGWSGTARAQVDEDHTDQAGRTVVERLRTTGFLGRTVAYLMTGVFIAAAGVARDADVAGGLDAALREVQQRPWGPAALAVVGLGYLANALYLGALARWHAG